MLTFKPWKLESVLQLLLGVFGGILFVGFLCQALGYRPVPGQIDAVMLIVNAIGFHGVGLLWLHWFLRDHQLTWPTALGLGSPNLLRTLGLGLVVGVGGFLVCFQLNAWMARVLTHFALEPEAQSTVRALQNALSPAWIVMFGIVSIGLAPVFEEFVFRGLLYPLVKQLGYPRLALGGTVLLFALVHANLQAFIPLAVLAVALTWLYEKTDNLLAPVTAHAVFNAINFALTVRFGALSSAGAS